MKVIALDGEGYTVKKTGRHLYTYVAASTSSTLVSEHHNPKGISTQEMFDWLLGLPKDYRLVGYSLGYDWTKWLEDLPAQILYMLYHPEDRPGKFGPVGLKYSGYRINLVSTRFSLATTKRHDIVDRNEGSCEVWDVWKFFQSSFVKALKTWEIGTEEERDWIQKMKDLRGNFQDIGEEEKKYCQSECILLAQLVEKLIQVHEEEGFSLKKSMYGPGTTAGQVLARCASKEENVAFSQSANVEDTQFSKYAFFGGRFECSHVGPVDGPLYAYDIASAYPYALCLLPCLNPKHGKWKHVRGSKLEQAIGSEVACIQYRVEEHPEACLAWGPLPHRLPDGNIMYPTVSAGGWAWSVEFRQAMKLHPGVTPLRAWVWERACDCPPPFREEVIRLYLRRLQLGKGSQGIPIKLAMNSMYGKSAQRVGGGGRYHCLVRAGLVTARTRAMLLEAVLLAKNPWNILELATDSVLSTEPLKLPLPIELGTAETAANSKDGAVLGSWEQKPWPGGVFLLRPGLRFPIEVDVDAKKIASRGVGTSVMQRNMAKIMKSWAEWPLSPVYVQQPPLFHGAKSSVRRVLEADITGDRPWFYKKDKKVYGKWITHEPRILSFEPGPKRYGIGLPMTVGAQAAYSLSLWKLPDSKDAISSAYGIKEKETVADILREEQPELGLFDPF